MALIKYNPNGYRPATFSNFVDRFFDDDFFGGKTTSSFSPQVDIAETSKQFELQFHLSGVKKEDIKIDIHDDKLIVSGERKRKEEKNEKNYHTIESFYGTFSRSFYLPDNVSLDKIDASYNDGVLNVVIPKDEKKETKKTINIK
ncbi:MAG: Hsp20/alpha crystallin family protein [Marinoscillum sp.]